jgi:hypothetical protein
MMRRFLWTCRTEVVRSMCTSWRTLVQYCRCMCMCGEPRSARIDIFLRGCRGVQWHGFTPRAACKPHRCSEDESFAALLRRLSDYGDTQIYRTLLRSWKRDQLWPRLYSRATIIIVQWLLLQCVSNLTGDRQREVRMAV